MRRFLTFMRAGGWSCSTNQILAYTNIDVYKRISSVKKFEQTYSEKFLYSLYVMFIGICSHSLRLSAILNLINITKLRIIVIVWTFIIKRY